VKAVHDHHELWWPWSTKVRMNGFGFFLFLLEEK